MCLVAWPVCLVARPLDKSEAGIDIVLIEGPLFLLCQFLLINYPDNSTINIRKTWMFLSQQGKH